MVWQPMTSVYVAPLPEQPFASVAVTTIGNVPDCVGVPERTPVALFSVMPAGSVEAVLYATVPIVLPEVKVTVNGALTVPVLVAGLVTVMVWQPMTSVYVPPFAEQPLPSTTCATIGNEPVCVGVPERTPAVESESPAGSVLAVVKVKVPTVLPAVKLWLKAAFTVPVVVPGLLTVMVWQAMVSVYVVPEPLQLFASVAVTTIGKEPVCVGVPERTPPVDNVRPVGSA